MSASNTIYDNEAFWRFSCQVYEFGDMKEKCLYWQEVHGLNVNLLLMSIWLDAHQKYIKEEVFLILKDALATTDKKIYVIRSQRRNTVKGTDDYKYLLDTELQLEKQQQRDLCNMLQVSDMNSVPQCSANSQVERYFKLSNIPAESREHIEFIIFLKKNNYFQIYLHSLSND